MTRAEIVLLLAVLAIAGGGLYWWLSPSAQDELAERFAPHVDSYLEQARQIADKQDDGGITGPPLGSGTVAIDVSKKSLDALHALLPDKYRATSPADVTTVILVECKHVKSGSYGFFKDAYNTDCRLRSFNLKLKKQLWQGSNSNSPPKSIMFPIPLIDVIADRANQAMVDFLVRQTEAPPR